MTTLKQQHQRPEGALLEAAIAAVPKDSIRKLAKRAELSEGRVRQIVNGYQSQAGQVLTIAAPASTLARLALETRLTPDDLRTAGRADAADELRALLEARLHGAETVPPDKEEAVRELREWLESGAAGRPPASAMGLFSIYQLLDGLRSKVEEVESITTMQSQMNWRLIHEQRSGGDGDADDATAGGPAPTSTKQDDYELVADADAHMDEEAEADPHA